MKNVELSDLTVGMQVMVETQESIEGTSTLVAREYKRNGKVFFIDDIAICGELVEVVEIDLDSLTEVQVVDEAGNTTWISAEFLQAVDEVVKEETESGTFENLNGGCKACKCGGNCEGQACEEHHDEEFQESF